MKNNYLPLNLQLFAEEGGNSGEGGNSNQNNAGATGTNNNNINVILMTYHLGPFETLTCIFQTVRSKK